MVFTDAANQTLDLHWQVLRRNCGLRADESFLQGGIATQIEGVSTSVLCPEEQLLQVCTDGSSSHAAAAIGWVADAIMLLRSSAS